MPRKKTLVLIPGWLHDFSLNPIFINNLIQDYNVYTYTYPGYLQTQEDINANSMEYLADQIDKLVKKEKIGKFTLLGFSLGSQVALHYAQKYNFDDQMILVGASFKKLSKLGPSYVKHIIHNKLAFYFVWHLKPLKRYLVNVALSVAHGLSDKKEKPNFSEKVASLDAALLTILASLRSYINPTEYIKQTAFIWGENDKLLKTAPKGLKPYVIKDAVHSPFHSHPEQMADVIREIMTQDV